MDDVARIRERIDIVSLISEYIPLKKMGRNFKALCPFHTEKTASFVVSPERQIWHCFGGCAKGGDAFTFLMEYEKLEFIEALRILAKKTGVELGSSNFQAGLSARKEKIYILNKIALEFYHFVLTKHPAGKQAINYLLNERKIDIRLIETFKLGFSPKSGTSLSNYLINKKKFKKQDLLEASLAFTKSDLAFEKDGKVFDFFKNRVMFPLFDHRGNVVGFSGRAIDTNYYGGKYINTRETLVYHKGSMFFGLNMAKDEIKKQDRAIVVEGEFDAISLYSLGFKNVIAIKGTALTEDQVNLLSRFTKTISLCFDQDQAGYEATKRSVSVLEKKGFSISAVVITNGKDADEAIKNDPFAFKKAVKDSYSVYDYIFDHTFALLNKNSIDSKRQISNELLPIIHNIENEIVKEHYLKKLCFALETSYESLTKELERIAKKEIINKDIVFDKKYKRSRKEVLEEYLLALIIQNENPKEALEKAKKILEDYKFEVLPFQKIIIHIIRYCEKQERFDGSKFLALLPQELVQAFDACFLFPLPKFANNIKIKEEVEKVARELRALFLRNKIQLIAQNLKNEEKDQNSRKKESLEKELSSLISLLSKG